MAADTATADQCPACQQPAVERCRCIRGDRRCRAGHTWHVCTVHHVVVRGPAAHDLDTDVCSCPRPARVATRQPTRLDREGPPPSYHRAR